VSQIDLYAALQALDIYKKDQPLFDKVVEAGREVLRASGFVESSGEVSEAKLIDALGDLDLAIRAVTPSDE
jgi:hypothetical protein